MKLSLIAFGAFPLGFAALLFLAGGEEGPISSPRRATSTTSPPAEQVETGTPIELSFLDTYVPAPADRLRWTYDECGQLPRAPLVEEIQPYGG